MTYQLMRVEAEVYRAGDTIKGITNVSWHNGNANGLCVWMSPTGNMCDAATLTREKITFTGQAVFVRLAPIGLEYDGIMDGELDYEFSMRPIPEVLGPAAEQIFRTIMANSSVKEDGRTIVFVAVLDLVDRKCVFKGLLPLDGSLDSAIIH